MVQDGCEQLVALIPREAELTKELRVVGAHVLADEADRRVQLTDTLATSAILVCVHQLGAKVVGHVLVEPIDAVEGGAA